MVPAVDRLVAIEPDSSFCQEIRKRLPGQALIEGTVEDVPPGTSCDGVLNINVLEHIREDEAELRRYHGLLVKRSGMLNLLVPARQEIYAPIDKDFGHHRRYSKAELRRKLEAAGFEIVRLRYFNGVGYFAWWFVFGVLKRRQFDVKSVRFFDRMIFPWVYGFESKVMAPPFGQSLLAVARAR